MMKRIIFGYAGSEDIYDFFVRYVVGDLVILRDDPECYTYQNMISKFGMIINKIRNIYKNTFLLDVIVARQFPDNGQSDLFLVRCNGSHQQILEWRAIGSGEPVANKVINRFWNNKITMKYFAEIAHSIIKYIEEERPDLGVGVGNNKPSIKYLKNGGKIDTSPDDKEFSDFENAYSLHKKEFKKIISSEYL